ncbi:MAG: hypothetical protein OJF51_004505 [Nitrospira sp.]|nr:MAG: hypothetical protein OJF51_004505 [Nitrospira sp.]
MLSESIKKGSLKGMVGLAQCGLVALSTVRVDDRRNGTTRADLRSS